MDDLRILTGKVCDVARTAGRFLKEERKSFRREAVEEKHAHDYVSYVDKESEKRIVAALGALLPEAGFIWRRARQSTGMSRIVGWWTRLTVLPIIFMAMPPTVSVSLCATSTSCCWELFMTLVWTSVSMLGRAVAHTLMDSLYKYLPSVVWKLRSW